jgi:elongation factor Ts
MGPKVIDIKKLRALTGAGIADCREALVASGGGVKKAAEILKKKGLERAKDKEERETGQGRAFTYTHATGKIGVVLSLLCETDFVAKTDEFNSLGRELCLQIASMNPKDTGELLKQEYIRDASMTVDELIKQTIGKLGENIKINEFVRLTI